MASLEQPHWEAVIPTTRDAIRFLASLPDIEPFYLAGGTALALRLGHRISLDLDLFAEIENFNDSWRANLERELNSFAAFKTNQNSLMGLVMSAQNLDISFFTYGYPLLAPLDFIEGLKLAGLVDIGMMKLDAIGGRGFKKDFFDVFVIAQTIPLDELFEASRLKYPYAHGFGMRILRSMVDFRQADAQLDPILLAPLQWDEVKKFFLSEAKRIGKKSFGEK
ncbi:MAG: hypothetical protein EYC68_14895 [Chloroflexota bacterium]|nr:MAG: hypothetical protein EYC68_14895 [Chloroflexota bacterium]